MTFLKLPNGYRCSIALHLPSPHIPSVRSFASATSRKYTCRSSSTSPSPSPSQRCCWTGRSYGSTCHVAGDRWLRRPTGNTSMCNVFFRFNTFLNWIRMKIALHVSQKRKRKNAKNPKAKAKESSSPLSPTKYHKKKTNKKTSWIPYRVYLLNVCVCVWVCVYLPCWVLQLSTRRFTLRAWR